MLAAGIAPYDQASPAWFSSPETDVDLPASIASPELQKVTTEWIVRLTEDATRSVDSIDQVAELLANGDVHFTVDRGLGMPGLVLARGSAISSSVSAAALQHNPNVATFSANDQVVGTLNPDDPEFVASQLIGLDNVGQLGLAAGADIDVVQAWDLSTGSTSVVVGVIDSGVDADHVDLYKNIWLNQGEIPTSFRDQLTDTDADGLITFYDLNEPINESFVTNFSDDNTYIDANDLLEDPRWADGFDTDGNGFVDDFFGWNFRREANEPFVANNPSDTLGHGTHIAGTIGAIGNNATGVTGINWRSSIMSLKFLDESNQGNQADAIAALNYARMMRTQFDTNIRVTNNSWGQPGSPNRLLGEAIEQNGEAGILFVAAAGNGDVLGRGIDNDSTPFYPASFEADNIIAVAASDGNDRLASFSNFGSESVDITGPGVGILSTLPGNQYGVANGTSMATPHVAGTIALLFSELPGADIAEVRQAVLGSAETTSDPNDLLGKVQSGGRVNTFQTLRADVFSPTATLIVPVDNIVESGADGSEFTVRFIHPDGIDQSSIGADDIVILAELAGNSLPVSVIGDPLVSADGREITVTYRVGAHGGIWDPLDFGRYTIQSVASAVESKGGRSIGEVKIGSFDVRIEDESVFYVNSTADLVDVFDRRRTL